MEGYEGSGEGGFATIGGRGRRGTGTREGWFAAALKRDIYAAVDRIAALKDQEYTANINVWFDTAGRISEIEVVRTSGNSQIDRALRESLVGALVSRVPPPDMQPVLMRIRSNN